jgi:hypothetical protein
MRSDPEERVVGSKQAVTCCPANGVLALRRFAIGVGAA